MQDLPGTTLDRLRRSFTDDPLLELWRIHVDPGASFEPVLALVSRPEPVDYAGVTYYPWPIVRGTDRRDDRGGFPALTLNIGNPTREFAAYFDTANGLRRSTVTRTLVLRSQLSVSNAAIQTTYAVASSAMDDKEIALTLEAFWRRQVKIPQFSIHSRRCAWRFGDGRCGYNRSAAGAGFSECPRTPGACRKRGDDEARRGLPRAHPLRAGFFSGMRPAR